MPWKVASAMEERIKFVLECLKGEVSKVALCAKYGISRPTGDKWLARYEQEGIEGLREHSRARHDQPQRMAEGVAARLLKARHKHPSWGAAKVKAHLERIEPDQRWPAASTIGDLFHLHGLTVSRKRKRHVEASVLPLSPMVEPNAVWCADFKGWFRTGDGTRCDPLTITDGHSRYLVCCQAVAHTDSEHVQAVFEACFRTYGMPFVLRTDNGPPFASRGLLGLSRLSLWWSKLGIIHERIEPGKPQQNGRHERMHKTLKAETASPPMRTLRIQQRVFGAFRDEYNNERPHEALGQRPPADVYVTSPRSYTGLLKEVSYPQWMDTRLVERSGQITWHGRRLFVSETLRGEPIGLEDRDDGNLTLWYADMAIGVVRISTMEWVKNNHIATTVLSPPWGRENCKQDFSR